MLKEKKVKVTLEQAMKAQRKLYSFFNLGARGGVGGQRHSAADLPSVKKNPVPIV